jgi:phosphonate transport system substrate-binding protein
MTGAVRNRAGGRPSLAAFQATLGRALRLTALGFAAMTAPAQATARGDLAVRLGFTARTLADANHADVTAAMKAWLLTLARERHLEIQPEVQVFDAVADMENALRQERLDWFNATTDEFLVLDRSVPLSNLFASKVNGRITEQYVLLVHKDRPVADLKDLRGETLVLLDHPRAALAPMWLEVELQRRRLPASSRFLGRITLARKPAMAILPVFFKQAVAALVTRSGFETAAELNPQLAKNLRVLLTSPEVVPYVGGFRSSAVGGAVELYRREALNIGDSQGGRMFLNLFQSDGVTAIRRTDLAGTMALLAEFARGRHE